MNEKGEEEEEEMGIMKTGLAKILWYFVGV